VLIVAGIVRRGSEAQDRPDGSIVVNRVDELVPGDWGLLDDLAFSLYSDWMVSINGVDVTGTYKKLGINLSYDRAHYFLKNMEKVRKPYIEGTNK